MKLGKKPARVNATQLKLATYLDSTILPKVPAEFGHEKAIADYGMLGNDEVGDCVWAGAGHETMIWGREANADIEFTEQSVISDYSAVTGYNPQDPETDGGTDMQVAASYRRRVGVLDGAGRRHKVGAYVALTPGDPVELAAATYIFGAVGIGLRVPAYMEDEFRAGKPWDVRHGNADIVGGHYVPVVARRGGNFCVVTWGRVQEMTVGFYRRYCDEALVYLSTEMLTSGISPEGFNLAALQSDLQAFTRR